MIFQAPLPLFDPEDGLHQTLVAGARAERVAGEAELPIVGFQQARVLIRALLTTDGVRGEINEAAEHLLTR